MPALIPTLETPLRELDWLPPARIRQLERFGLDTVGRLVTHFPRRHEDRSRFDQFPGGDSETPVCVCGLVKKTQLRRLRGRQKMFDAVLEEERPHALSTPLVCRWFNAHWVEKALLIGQRLVVYGKPKRSGSNVVIAHPEFEVVEDDAEVVSVHLNRIAPVHRATEGLSARVLRRIIWDALAQLDESSVETLVPTELDRHPRLWALRQIHFPDTMETLAAARRHLVLEEFLAMQLCVGARRVEHHEQPGESHSGAGELARRLHAALPFSLTHAQERAIAEIQRDVTAARPMNRLLHGDVGSGKTLVALSAMLNVVEAGWQAALMAPTQILAEQHYLAIRQFCEPLGLRISLRTAAKKEDHAPLPLFEQCARIAPPGSTAVPAVSAGVPPVESDVPAGSKYSKRLLPHFERPWAKYMVTFSTRDRRILSPAARDIVFNAIRHQSQRVYELYAACVMPDHVHLLFEPNVKDRGDTSDPEFYSLTEILHSLKSFTAHEVNKLEKTKGSLWDVESFDRMIRSETDLQEKHSYITRDPWSDGVAKENEDYPWVWFPEREAELVEREAGRPTNARDRSAGRRPEQPGRLCSPEVPTSRTSIPDDQPQLIIGTHALLHEDDAFSRLGLVVIDEQHKFGVCQRARLREKGTAPDVLVMTATPIPRTLTMTIYGDLDVSTLDELPKGRGKIVTAVREAAKLPEAAKFLREQLESGRQAYVVYPLIEESERLEAKAAAQEFAKWREMLAPLPCELLHGRIAPEEKEAVMNRFRRGETKVLIATTVIEVGIDVPNANLMLIENAERFGLAQLHQLRGRIGRGAHKSYCILLTGPKADADALEKLRGLEQTSDGFEIAEADLRLRGPGD
ncbi:MAG: DEAD/DEAH box helicase, partial [Chthoniobacteraceae bacterium]